MTSTSAKSTSRIIVALDVETADAARSVIDELHPRAAAFKIGLQLFTVAGPGFVREVAERHRVFLDLKFHDIPNTVAAAGVEAARLGVWMFNVHSSGGGEMMRRMSDAVSTVCERESLERPLMIGVTVLTSSDANTLREIGIESQAEEQVLRLACLTAECGLDGVVASPLETNAVRTALPDRPDFLIVTPGVRPAFATNDDQKRVMTPQVAVLAGSDFLVIGRPVLQAADRAAALEGILDEIDASENG